MNINEYLKTINPQLKILEIKRKPVSDDGLLNMVYLVGTKDDNSPYIQNINIVIQNNDDFYLISPPINSGYDPSMTIKNFTKEHFDSILLSINSGGSGGFSFYYIYNLKDKQPHLIFNFEDFNQKYLYEVKYEDNYKIKVTNKTLEQNFIIDIANRPKDYLDNLYDSNGKLKKETLGDVSEVNSIYPISYTNNGFYDLIVIQRIIGLYNADLLGYVITSLSYQNDSFENTYNMQYLMIQSQKNR